MKRLLLIAAFGSLVASAALAQVTTGPVTTAMRFAWNLPANVTLAQAPTFEVRLRVDGTPATALTGVTCVAATPTPSCTAALSASNVDALNQVGAHAITLSLFRADVGESSQSSPFALTAPAGAPTGVRIIP